jgi:branched-chain amino acid transport system permease protein
MSWKKFNILSYSSTPAPRPWRDMLLANVPVAFVLLAMIPLGQVLDENLDPYYLRIVMLIGFNIILAVSLQLINGFSGQFSLGHAGFMAVGAYLAGFPAIEYSNNFDDPANTILFFVSLLISVGLGVAVLWVLFVGMRRTRTVHRALPGILLIVLLVWIVTDFAKASQYPQRPMWAIWTGFIEVLERLFNALVSGAGPVAAKVSAALPGVIRRPICFCVLLYGAGCCASAVGFIVGLPALRLRGDYLAIATLGFGEIIRIGIQNSNPLGAALGLTSIPKYTDFTWLYVVVIITVVTVWRIAYSGKGRAIMAVRDDEIAAGSIGVNTTTFKVMAFTIGAFFAGVAGALFSLHERSITPGYFNVVKSIEPVVMVTLGGLGSISGAILAAIVLTLLPEVLRGISPEDRMVIYSLLLVVMMILRPQGLLGGRELWPRRRGPRRAAPVTATEQAVPA